jgi:tRNA-dihydrouridine synthase
MLAETHCTGIAIGRGALLNPWIFTQLQRWEETSDPGPRASYEHHLDFMSRHYHLLVDQRGEHFASLTFRKVANWYCKVLRPGRAIQQRLMFLDSAATFDAIVQEIRDAAAVIGTADWIHPEPSIAVPQGPIERW